MDIVDLQKYGKRSVAGERFSIILTCIKLRLLYECQEKHKLFVCSSKRQKKTSGYNI